MNLDILENLTAIAKTKNLGKDVVLDTLKESLVIAAKKYLGLQKHMEVEIDETTNLVNVYLRITVVDDYPDVDPEMDAEEVRLFDEKFMLLDEARSYNSEAAPEDFLEMEIPIENFGRAAISTAKQMLLQKIRDAERELIYGEYCNKVGDIVSGSVQQIDRGTIFVNLGKAEAVLPAKEQIRKERYRQGETIRAYIAEVNNETKGHQIVLSRAHPNFLAKLFELEVPEISDGTVAIRGVSRDPGYRAKISVVSKDDRIDPVGACVGMKGNRVQAIVRELSNERIDIIHWTDDINTYIKRALSPADIRQINDIGDGRIVVIVSDEDLSQAIGRGGQNVRLASKLLEKELDIYGLTEFNKMTDDDKEILFEPIEVDDEPEENDSPVFVPEKKETKFSELESLFKKNTSN
ncbi:MAG: transcription termination factor NusA [Fibrobacteria bacterium]|nr:transcription termination factor NusA [Fibrobacteria bacterium]